MPRPAPGTLSAFQAQGRRDAPARAWRVAPVQVVSPGLVEGVRERDLPSPAQRTPVHARECDLRNQPPPGAPLVLGGVGEGLGQGAARWLPAGWWHRWRGAGRGCRARGGASIPTGSRLPGRGDEAPESSGTWCRASDLALDRLRRRQVRRCLSRRGAKAHAIGDVLPGKGDGLDHIDGRRAGHLHADGSLLARRVARPTRELPRCYELGLRDRGWSARPVCRSS